MRKIPRKIDLNRSDADGHTLASSYSSFDISTLQKSFYTLQSPNKSAEIETVQPSSTQDHLNHTYIFSWHHSTNKFIKNKRIPAEENLRLELNSYIQNALSAFINTCFKTRVEFHTELKEKEELFKLNLKQGEPNPIHSSIVNNISSNPAPLPIQNNKKLFSTTHQNSHFKVLKSTDGLKIALKIESLRENFGLSKTQIKNYDNAKP